jgi:hypothetical protein
MYYMNYLDIEQDVPLALAIVAVRFDPKVVRIQAVADSANSGVSFTQSTDESGVCLISISNLGKATGASPLLYVEVQGVGLGDAALLLDKDSSHLVATDARDLTVNILPVRATVKQ